MARKPRASNNANDVAGNVIDGEQQQDSGTGIIAGEPLTADPLSAVAADANSSGGNGDGSSDGFTPTGRRKRKYGKRDTASNSPQENIRVDVLSQLLISSHLMIAAALDIEELKLSDSEAKQVSEAYATLAEFYPALQQSPKTLAIVNFVSALGWVYGTRMVAIFNNRKEKAEQKPAGNVQVFSPGLAVAN